MPLSNDALFLTETFHTLEVDPNGLPPQELPGG